MFSLCISREENAEISRVPNPQEIKDVIWDMHPLKAPGPDGLPGLFFKKYWSTIRSQVSLAIQNFFKEGWLLPQVNHTFITLIPKKLSACNFNQFRPISLCNFYYKVIAKILVNRLRPLLSRIIDPSQSAFVPNRWIIENVLVAHEVVHSFKKSKRKKSFVGLKLDFHKSYDCLEWEFIHRVLKAVGFDDNVAKLINQCLSTVRFTLLLNGTKSSSITPSKGIRQGDPLSPYLFILCIEVLARLINRETDAGKIHGAKIATGAPGITKLVYADDVLLFYGAKISEIDVLMSCVNKLCGWSGLSVSTEEVRTLCFQGSAFSIQ